MHYVLFADLVRFTPVSQRSYDIRLLDRLTISLEFILFIVAIITVVYAIRSFKSSKKQNELSTVPHIFFETDGTFPNQKLFLVKDNDTLAYDFKIDNLYLKFNSTHTRDWLLDVYKFKFDFDNNKRNFMSKGHNQILIKVYKNDVLMKDDEEGFVAWVITENADIKDDFWIWFTDSQNIRYYTRINFKMDGVAYINRAPARYSLFARVYKMSVDIISWINRTIYRCRIIVAKISHIGTI